MTNYLATTSEHMARFQYVWHNIMGKCSLEIQNNKTFKYALKVTPGKPINLRKQIHIFEVQKKNRNRKLINSLYRKLVKIYEIKRVKSSLILTVIPSNNVTIGKYQKEILHYILISMRIDYMRKT